MSARTSSLSCEDQAFAVLEACVRISLICSSVSRLAFFRALSIAFSSSRWASNRRSSCFQSSGFTVTSAEPSYDIGGETRFTCGLSEPSHSGCWAVLSKRALVLNSSHLPSAAAGAVRCNTAAI